MLAVADCVGEKQVAVTCCPQNRALPANPMEPKARGREAKRGGKEWVRPLLQSQAGQITSAKASSGGDAVGVECAKSRRKETSVVGAGWTQVGGGSRFVQPAHCQFSQKSSLLSSDILGSLFPTLRNAWPTEHRVFETVSAWTGLQLGDAIPLQWSCPNAWRKGIGSRWQRQGLMLKSWQQACWTCQWESLVSCFENVNP